MLSSAAALIPASRADRLRTSCFDAELGSPGDAISQGGSNRDLAGSVDCSGFVDDGISAEISVLRRPSNNEHHELAPPWLIGQEPAVADAGQGPPGSRSLCGVVSSARLAADAGQGPPGDCSFAELALADAGQGPPGSRHVRGLVLSARLAGDAGQGPPGDCSVVELAFADAGQGPPGSRSCRGLVLSAGLAVEAGQGPPGDRFVADAGQGPSG